MCPSPSLFRNVLGNFAALLQGNPAVFATIITTLVVYLLLLVWTKRADRSDKIKVSHEIKFNFVIPRSPKLSRMH